MNYMMVPRYHKEERVWITRAPGMAPSEKTTTYERGTYYFFDVNSWRKVGTTMKMLLNNPFLRYPRSSTLTTTSWRTVPPCRPP